MKRTFLIMARSLLLAAPVILQSFCFPLFAQPTTLQETNMAGFSVGSHSNERTNRADTRQSLSTYQAMALARITVNDNITYYEDWDEDGYGNPFITTQSSSGPPAGFVANNDDCDDTMADTYPGAQEICGDELDNDCDGLVDEDCPTKLQDSQCGTIIATIFTDILAYPINEATQYRFRLVNGANVQTIDIGTPSFKMTQLASFEFNTTYTVDVKVEVDGMWQDYGPACNISTPEADCGLWLGMWDNLWSNPQNWSCGTVPGSGSNVTIYSEASFMPVVDDSYSYCNNLTIQSGASITINAGAALGINGSVTNDGSLTSLGKVAFYGDNQTIPGGTFTDLEIGSTTTLMLGGAATVSGTLTLSSGILQLGNNDLTIGSGGSIAGGEPTAYIAPNGTGKLIQQNIGTGGRTGAILFPVGTANSFTPLTVTNTGTADDFGASLTDSLYASYNTSDLATGAVQLENNVNRTWFLTEAVPGGSNVTLTFQWNEYDELSGFDRYSAFPSHYTNGAWQAGSVAAPAGSGPYTISMSGITSFSPFGIGSTNSVLPLTLLSFTGKEAAEGIALHWTTSHEVNTAGFDIERSTNGGNFVALGTVPAGRNGAYSYTDNNVTEGSTYSYRLKMRDKDGRFTHSFAITLKYKGKQTAGYSIYPNPVADLYIYVKPAADNNNDIKIDIIDMNGRTLSTHAFTNNNMSNGSFKVPVNRLLSGSYILSISDKSGERLQVTKFTVNH